MAAFGEKLRKQREQRGLTLDAISNTTKISTRMLRALEDEHFDQLPGGVFNKGFVRAYARQVGLDEEEALTDYLVALRESQIQQQTILPDFRAPDFRTPDFNTPDFRTPAAKASQITERDIREGDLGGQISPEHVPSENAGHDVDHGNHDSPGEDAPENLRTLDRRRADRRRRSHDSPPLPGFATQPLTDDPPAARQVKYAAASPDQPSVAIPWGKLALALLLVILALALWNFRRHRQVTAESPAAATPLSSIAAPLSTPVAATTASSQHSPAPTSPRNTAAPESSAGPISAAEAASQAASAVPAAMASPKDDAVNSALESATIKRPSRPSANKPLPTLTLKIRAEKTTWVAIMADGKPVAQETLIAPANTSVRATREIVVRAGNAAGVSFELNGKDVPVKGNEAEVKTFVFDAAGMRPQAQLPATNR